MVKDVALYYARTVQERNEGLTACGVLGCEECSVPRTDTPPHSRAVVVWV